MDNVININNTKENTLEFEMVIEGTTTTDVDCNFVIVAKGMEFRFPAELTEGKKDQWTVTLPEMNFLERTAYNCYTEVVAEGQYFKPMQGSVNVVGTAQIYTSSPKNKTIESDTEKAKVVKEQETKRETKRKQESWRQSEKPISQIAKELMEQEKYGKAGIDKKVKAKKKVNEAVDKDKDAKVKAILEESGLKPKKKKKSRVTFVNTKPLH